MKRVFALSVMGVVLASAAFAGPPAKKSAMSKKPQAATIACSVMPARMVNIKDATAHKMFADYKGGRYFFCCGGCPGEFKKSPAKFASNAHIPTPKTAGKKV